MPEMPSKVFLINPTSGKIPLEKKKTIIEEIMDPWDSKIHVASSATDAAETAYMAMNEKKIVIACGGDGLQSIVAEQAIKTGGTMTVLPFGRGNDFANSLNITSPIHTRDAILLGKTRQVRYLNMIFESHSKICLTCAGVGLLSEASHRAENIPIIKGKILYSLSALLCILNLKTHKFLISTDNHFIEQELLILVAAVSKFTGGGMLIAPNAEKELAKFNLLSARKVSRTRALLLLKKVLSGTHLLDPNVSSKNIKKCTIDTMQNNFWSSIVYGDGESLGKLPVTICLGEQPLKVLVP